MRPARTLLCFDLGLMLNLNLRANAGTGAPVDRQCRGSAMQGTGLSNLVPSDDTSGSDEPFPLQTEDLQDLAGCTVPAHTCKMMRVLLIPRQRPRPSLVALSLCPALPCACALAKACLLSSPSLRLSPHERSRVAPRHVGPCRGRNLDPCALGPGTFSCGIALNLPRRGRTHRRRAGALASWPGPGARRSARPRVEVQVLAGH